MSRHPIEVEFLEVCRRAIGSDGGDTIALAEPIIGSEGSIRPTLVSVPERTVPPKFPGMRQLDRHQIVELASRTASVRSQHFEHGIGMAWQPDDWRGRLADRFPGLSCSLDFGPGWHDIMYAAAGWAAEVGGDFKLSYGKEKFGILSLFADELPDDLPRLDALAERLSACICEDCGAPGRRRPGGWIRTLCDDCAGKKR